MGRSWTALTLFALLLSVTLVACSPTGNATTVPEGMAGVATRTPAPFPSPSPDPSPQPTQIITIWLDWEYDELQVLYELLERYQRDHPDVEFALSYRPRESLLQAFQNAVSEGEGPSILLGPAAWGPGLRELGLILNLSPLLDPGMESEVHPIAWTQAAEGTQLFGLPLELQGMVLYRNRSLVAQPIADLEELGEIGELLEADGRISIIADLELEIALPFIAACGEDLYDARGDLTLFQRGGECWLGLLSIFGSVGEVVVASEADLESFMSGQAAWLIASTDKREELVEAIGITNLEVDPWPLHLDTGLPLRGFTWSENAYLAAGSTESNLEAAWTFVQFLFGEDGQAILSRAGHIPTTSAFDPPDSLMLASSSMLRAGVPYPLDDRLEQVQEPLTAAIQAAVMQGAEPAFALRLAEERLELLNASTPNP